MPNNSESLQVEVEASGYSLDKILNSFWTLFFEIEMMWGNGLDVDQAKTKIISFYGLQKKECLCLATHLIGETEP